MPSEIGAFAPFVTTSSITTRQSANSKVNVGIDVQETTPPGDTVEILNDGSSGQGGASQGGSGIQVSPAGTYTPGALSDRFRYEINNGFLNMRNRFHVNVVTAGSEAAATYAGRGQVRSLAVRGGLAGMQGAIFALQYRDFSPADTGNGIVNREAINEYRRIAEQNLPLLSMIG